MENDIRSITMVPSEGGRFEVSVDGNLLYSKLETGRHIEPGEVTGLIKNYSRSKHA